jgi:hypothetical protein
LEQLHGEPMTADLRRRHSTLSSFSSIQFLVEGLKSAQNRRGTAPDSSCSDTMKKLTLESLMGINDSFISGFNRTQLKEGV